MTHKMPYGEDRKARNKERVDEFLGRKSGGRVKDKDEGTNIHIEINAKDDQQGASDLPPVPPMAGPIPPPPPAPPMQPPGAPPGLEGAIGGGGPMAGLKRGGRATFKAGAGSGEGREEKSDVTRKQRPKS